jgi:hypothetical protein
MFFFNILQSSFEKVIWYNWFDEKGDPIVTPWGDSTTLKRLDEISALDLYYYLNSKVNEPNIFFSIFLSN